MATKYWLGTADAVTQIIDGSIDSIDATPANDTFTVTIGGDAISIVGITDEATTAAALVVLLEASTNPYFAAMTWTNPSGALITGTADEAGVPTVAALTQSGGTGTVTDFTDTVAATGPNFWDNALNWSTGVAPVNSDDIFVEDTDVSITYGLAQSGVTLDSLIVRKTFTGKIGLDSMQFATSADGDTLDPLKTEYRESYLEISATIFQAGEHFGPGEPGGSQRIKINTGSNVMTGTIFDTASTSAETGKPSIRILNVNASSELFVRLAPAGVGVAVDVPGEVSTLSLVSISDTSGLSQVSLSRGVTLTTYNQQGGTNVLESAGTITTVTCSGGTLTTEGDYLITTAVMEGGVWNANHLNSGGDAIATLNASGGSFTGIGSTEPRTWGIVNPNVGSAIVSDPDYITITTLNDPSGAFTLSVS